MKTMCPHGYYQSGFVATHALGHVMYGYLDDVRDVRLSDVHIYYAHLASVRFEHSVCCGYLYI